MRLTSTVTDRNINFLTPALTLLLTKEIKKLATSLPHAAFFNPASKSDNHISATESAVVLRLSC